MRCCHNFEFDDINQCEYDAHSFWHNEFGYQGFCGFHKPSRKIAMESGWRPLTGQEIAVVEIHES
jgi:hypothetical protein